MDSDIINFIRTVPDYPVKGINFYDLNSLFAGPMFNQTIDALVEKADYFDVPTHIVGIESRGFVLGSAIAYAMNLPFVMVRKQGSKYPGELLQESYDLEYGSDTLVLQKGLLGHTSRVILVDDLVATGGSITATKRLVEQTGATTLGALTVVDLKYARQNVLDLELYALYYEWNLNDPTL
jgi:adenine phosphoribosyltransferase